jgi:molybdate transport system substrate-binding protein
MSRASIPARLAAALLALALLIAVGGCGDSDDKPQSTLKVSAAASLQDAFEDYADTFEDAENVDVQLQFAGSDALAAQIQKGARPGVFAAANMKLPEQLEDEGLVETPQPFTTNKLVIAVPKSTTKITSIDDLADGGVKIAAGSESVPVGAYTRKVLAGLPSDQRKAIVANIKSSEPDVKGVVGKVSTGAVDAGFVYASDVKAADDELTAIELPSKLQPVVLYGISVVKGSGVEDLAQKFIDGLLAPTGQKILIDEGFGPLP